MFLILVDAHSKWMNLPVYYRHFLGRGNRTFPGDITESLGGKGYVIWDTTENKVVIDVTLTTSLEEETTVHLPTLQRLPSGRRHYH